ncbi:hypothetical protein BDV25DRAFT_113393 [Aspergillus avenaceus]|uniref:Extracellular membrane protein CFEM domain-containing protein n=1 Tax=Aspergillus avenaceus TaxID=36643 RepID=A0A5N6TVC1_ASPAV|nr:hypothetical protein BDV25DRAFT_113393 [Aspergillus avenaceus]
MKLNILALASLVALTAAQSASTSESAATATVSLTPQEQCVKSKCSANDICCVAGCYQVPCPNGSQANDTNSCVAACPQGTGSPSDTERYASCQANCFSSHYFPITATGGSGPSKTTASSADATTTGKGSSKTGSSVNGNRIRH